MLIAAPKAVLYLEIKFMESLKIDLNKKSMKCSIYLTLYLYILS